ncbi:hypothetical protein E3220_04845 [Piscirickettsia salmonis EM-90]|nr:hypothetical protein E3220_04845 [Piscirickettsia salmonis EM-90]
MECADSRHATLCDADSRGFIVVAFCSAILHHWMCKIPTEVATLTFFFFLLLSLAYSLSPIVLTLIVCWAWGRAESNCLTVIIGPKYYLCFLHGFWPFQISLKTMNLCYHVWRSDCDM